MLVKPAQDREVRDPTNLARILDPDAAFELPDDFDWQRLFHVFGDLVPADAPALDPSHP